MGLLSKASEITTVSNDLSFADFLVIHNIKTFAVFQLNENYYSIVNSIGFDAASLLASYSTKDFWDGICSKEEVIYDFDCTNKSQNPMLQFFSFELLETLQTVSIYKKNGTIYMLCNQSFNDNIINDIIKINYDLDKQNLTNINKNISKESILLKFNISCKEAVASYISIKAKDFTNTNNLKLSIYNEIINRFKCILAKDSIKRLDESSFKAVFIVDKFVHIEHLICHIVFYLRNILGTSAELISFSNEGKAESYQEIKDFLQVE